MKVGSVWCQQMAYPSQPQSTFSSPLLENSDKQHCLRVIDEIFSDHPHGLKINEFKTITVGLCKIPFVFHANLFKKIDVENTGTITRDVFVKYWVDRNMLRMDTETRIFNILKQPGCDHLKKEDFVLVLDVLCGQHRELQKEFKDEGELKKRYIMTVTSRIFFYINKPRNGCLTLEELKSSDLIVAIKQAEMEMVVGMEAMTEKSHWYFAYFHFDVIYYTFLDMDTDRDQLLGRSDIKKYGDYGLSSKMADRICAQASSNVEGKMCYEDFVYFVLAQEDKSSEPSLEYWFKCIDLDGDGKLTEEEIEYFYGSSLEKPPKQSPTKSIFQEIIKMIRPENQSYITLSDLKRSRNSAYAFNMLINPRRAAEMNFILKSIHQNPTQTEWGRFLKRYLKK